MKSGGMEVNTAWLVRTSGASRECAQSRKLELGKAEPWNPTDLKAESTERFNLYK